MEWRDEGVILSVRKHGETSAIAEILTPEHGRCLGLVRGGRSRQQRPVLQPGNFVAATWRARIEDHLGTFVFEPLKLSAGTIMEDAFRLSGLTTLAGLTHMLPEREPHQRLYAAFQIVLDAMDRDEHWPALLVRWELGLAGGVGLWPRSRQMRSDGDCRTILPMSHPRPAAPLASSQANPIMTSSCSCRDFCWGNP